MKLEGVSAFWHQGPSKLLLQVAFKLTLWLQELSTGAKQRESELAPKRASTGRTTSSPGHKDEEQEPTRLPHTVAVSLCRGEKQCDTVTSA